MKKDNLKKWNIPNKFFILFFLVILALYIQYCYLSLSKNIYGTDMKDFASSRNTVTMDLKAKRGTIYDVNGNVLALNTTSYTMIAYLDSSRTTDKNDPKHVVDKEYTATKLSQVMDADYDYILKRLNTDSYQVEFGTIGRNITELKKLSIEELKLPGIEFVETTTRYYPNGNFASYIVGYAKTNDDGEIEGKLGIESEYNDFLKGTDGFYIYQQDKKGYKIPDTPEQKVEAVNGVDIYLTIDSSIQRFAESAVKDITEKYNPEWVVIEVMDAKTGQILASSSNPSYDPNNIPIDMTYQNPLVSYAFEPGSTMKIYTYMCALEKGVYNGDETYLSGSYKVGDDTIRDWNGEGWGYISYDNGFEHSSNVAVANIISKYLSKDELYDCFTKYGFGSTTGIELSNELTGSLNFKYDIEILAAGYGQGISTTPIQHLQALSIIANNGYMVKPHIISKIVDENGEELVTNVDKSEKIVNDNTVKKIKELMRNVIASSSGTGHRYDIEGYDIIGKTGTAQIFENGNYSSDGYILSVALMYPYDDPEIIIYAAVKKPPENSTAVLADSIKELIQNIAKYRNMFDSNKIESNVNSITLESYLNKDVEIAKQNLKSNGINTVVIGDGNKVINQYPTRGVNILSDDYVFLLTNGNNASMPNMLGWSRNNVQAFCNLIDYDCEISGNGYVINQSISEGSTIDNNISINLENKR